MRRINTKFGRQSLIFRGPVFWNGLNSNTRNLVNKDQFKNALKKYRDIDQISFTKGTCINLNKNTEDFEYF